MSQSISLPSLLALLLALVTPTAQGETGPSVSAWVELERSGKIVDMQWDDSAAELSDADKASIEAQLRALSWQPSEEYPYTSRFGTSVEIHTATVAGKGLQIAHLRRGVSFVKFKPPRYPSSALRRKQEADLMAVVTVGSDGKVLTVKVLRSPEISEEFEKEVRDATQFWTFKPETADGRAVRGVINVPVRFSMFCRRGSKGFDVQAPAPASVVQVSSDRTDAELVELTASRKTERVKACDD